MKNRGLLFLVLVLTFLSFRTLVRPGYFPMHDDMQAMRVLQMDKCIQDLQLPCRWVPDMGYGYGYPQFNFYSPLPYYVMEVFNLVGFSILDSVKIGFILTFIISAIGMYLLGRRLWGEWGGALSSLFFVFAPYRAVDIYVRGAVGEFWALSILPFIFWAILKLKDREKYSQVCLALSLSALFLSHNVTTLISLPFIFLFILLVGVNEYLNSKNKKKFFNFLFAAFLSGIWGVALSSFFLLPALFEKQYAHVESLVGGYFDYRIHFVNIKRLLFDQFWGFGGSEYGPHDEIFLGVGLLHWITGLMAFIALLFTKSKDKIIYSLFFLFVSIISLFMIHSKSSFIWEALRGLKIIQFPWRFLVLSTFGFSVLTGGVLSEVKNKKVLFIVLTSLLLIINLNFFRPKTWVNITDEEKFSGENWRLAQTISIFDYLPIYSEFPPADRAPEEPQILAGEADVTYVNKKSYIYAFNIDVTEPATVEIPVFYFPGWELLVNADEVDFTYNNKLGLITIQLSKGSHQVVALFTDTPIRKFGNLLSLVSIFAVFAYLYKTKKAEQIIAQPIDR